MRKQIIYPEIKIWSRLRNRNLGYKFRRQFGIGKYIVDFYCPQLKLVVEVDGATHSEDYEIKKDNIRQKYLESLGLNIIRYTNHEVYSDPDSVAGDILNICNKIKSKI